MTSRPEIGDIIEHPFLGGDARIEVADVPEDQPLLGTDGLHVIVDQYGDTHFVDLDGDTWVAVSDDALSEKGFELWTNFQSGYPVSR